MVGLPDEKWGEVIGCFIRSEGDAPLDVEDPAPPLPGQPLAAEDAHRPGAGSDEFPLTGSRKIRKFRLREQLLAGEYDAE